jgi:hypothetical protein
VTLPSSEPASRLPSSYQGLPSISVRKLEK